MLAANIITKLIAFFLSIYLARYLGVADFGIYNFAMTYLSFFVITSGFGLDLVSIKRISRNKDLASEIVGNVLAVRLLTSTLSIFLCIFLFAISDPFPMSLYYISFLSLAIIFQSISYLLESIFQSYLKMQYIAITTIIQKIILFVLVVFVVVSGKNLAFIFLAVVIAEALRTLLNYYFITDVVQINVQTNFSIWKKLITESIPFFFGAAFYSLYMRVDVLMLSYMSDNLAVGLYSAAYKLTDPFIFLPMVLSSILVPVLSQKFSTKSHSFKKHYATALRYTFIIMLPIALNFTVFSDFIISIVYGVIFADSSVALKIISFSLLISSLCTIQSSILISSDKQSVNTRNIAFACIFNIVLNFIFIPKYSYIGASFTTLLSSFFLFILGVYSVEKDIRVSLIIFLKPLLSCIPVGGMLLLLKGTNPLLIIPTGFIIYYISLIIIREFNENDIMIITKILGFN